MLSDLQMQALQAAVERIIPADDYPSAWDAGAGNYFQFLFAREPRFLPVYQNGLDALDREAQAAANGAFAALPPGTQDALLAQIEAGVVQTPWIDDPARFFIILVQQTMESFYADPGNGGNKNGVAWDMIGYQMTG